MKLEKKNYQILVVEDNEPDFILISDYLEESISKLKITNVKSFKSTAAELAINKNIYDVVLLDLSLPDKSGAQLIEEILPLCTGLPIIVLTGFTDIEFSIKSLSLGISDYLLKDDINPSSLFKSIVYSIERKKITTRLRESEKRYSDIFQLSPQPMFIFDPLSLQILQVNCAAIKQYGYSEVEFLALTIADLREEEDRPKLFENLARKSINNETTFTGRVRHMKKSGESMEVELYANDIIINHETLTLVIAIDITENVLFENKLTQAIIKTQEDERNEIGGELHDNVCQILAGSVLHLERLRKSLPIEEYALLSQCTDYIKTATKEIRNLSHRLAPAFFDDATLENTFANLINSFYIADHCKTIFFLDPTAESEFLNREIKLTLYRILQEQLLNIVKYAKATNITVSVFLEDNFIKMKTEDNGIGFDITKIKSGIGLANMRRRVELFNGKLNITTTPGEGCEILVEIPLTK